MKTGRSMMKTRVFTAGLLRHDDLLLVLKRKEDDDAYPGLWDCVGGHFEVGESAEECMLRETREESGVKAQIVRPGRLIEYRDRYGRSIALPFLLESPSEKVMLTEHAEYAWLPPREVKRLRAVPSLGLMIADPRLLDR